MELYRGSFVHEALGADGSADELARHARGELAGG